MAMPEGYFAEDVNINPDFWNGFSRFDIDFVEPVADDRIELVVGWVLEDSGFPVAFHRVFDGTAVDFVQIQIELMDFAVIMVEIHQGVFSQRQM